MHFSNLVWSPWLFSLGYTIRCRNDVWRSLRLGSGRGSVLTGWGSAAPPWSVFRWSVAMCWCVGAVVGALHGPSPPWSYSSGIRIRPSHVCHQCFVQALSRCWRGLGVAIGRVLRRDHRLVGWRSIRKRHVHRVSLKQRAKTCLAPGRGPVS